MGMKTVRMEPEDERLLERLRRRTGWTSSDILKHGMRLLDQSLSREPAKSPYEVYAGLDLGPGGYASGPASQSREAARAAIMRKHRK